MEDTIQTTIVHIYNFALTNSTYNIAIQCYESCDDKVPMAVAFVTDDASKNASTFTGFSLCKGSNTIQANAKDATIVWDGSTISKPLSTSWLTVSYNGAMIKGEVIPKQEAACIYFIGQGQTCKCGSGYSGNMTKDGDWVWDLCYPPKTTDKSSSDSTLQSIITFLKKYWIWFTVGVVVAIIVIILLANL